MGFRINSINVRAVYIPPVSPLQETINTFLTAQYSTCVSPMHVCAELGLNPVVNSKSPVLDIDSLKMRDTLSKELKKSSFDTLPCRQMIS